MRRWLSAWMIAAPLLAQETPFANLKALFDYDKSKPLNAQVMPVRQEPGAKISEFFYDSAIGGRVDGYLVTPSTEGKKFAGLVFGHWGLGNRTEFLPEAVVYARAGAVSVLINYPWARQTGTRHEFHFQDGAKDREIGCAAVIDLRRAIDYLIMRPDVDRERIAYVGHSFGAQWGAILAAVDGRMKTCILIGGAASQEDLWEKSNRPEIVQMRKQYPAEKRAAYETAYSQLDAIRYVSHARPVALFFQFARFEYYFDERSMNKYFAAASEPKREAWYPTGHDLNDPAAWADRAKWLEKYIGLKEASSKLRQSVQ